MAAARIFTSPLMALRATSSPVSRRAFTSAARRLNEAASTSSASMASTAPIAGARATKPVGGFRGGIFGFLLGSSVAAYGTWTYVLEEYRLSNELLTEDIYALQAAIERVHGYVTVLEEKVDAMEKKR